MNFKNITLIGAALLLSAPVFGSTYFGGFEDKVGGDYDYQDLVFSLSGNGLTLNSGGKFYAQPALDNSGNPFWNHYSGDNPGATYNVGYCIYGGGACNGGKALDPGAKFLASAGNAAVSANDVTFSVSGNVSANVILSVASNTNDLGYYLVSDATHTVHSLGAAGNTYSFTPGGDFGLVGMNITQGTTYYSQSGLDSVEPGTSHFAFFNTATAPEPGMMGMMAAGLLSVGAFFRRKKSIQS